MGLMKKIFVFLIVVLFILLLLNYLYGPWQDVSKLPVSESQIRQNTQTQITVANWNLQIFGDSKASNPVLLSSYASRINDYDVIFVQEIRDSDGSSFEALCQQLPEYKCKISSRAGRSVSKEQYGLIYKNNLKIDSYYDYNPDSKDRWERPPRKVKINDVTIYNIHIKPDDVTNELKYLYEIVDKSENFVVLGDLNADCSYYNNAEDTTFDEYNWLIKDGDDTTIAKSSCAYDRIITNMNPVNYGIATATESDHYIIWLQV